MHRLPSRSRIVFAHSFGRFFGTLAKFTATITVGTRIGPRTVCTELSCGRIGSVIHSSHVTGQMWSSPSISSAVATLVAIMQNASCGVRTWMACQLRFSTSTIVLFRMSFNADASTEVTGARKPPVALTATAGYSQKAQHDEMEFADHHCRRPKRSVIHG